jgi:hypothetical protein
VAQSSQGRAARRSLSVVLGSARVDRPGKIIALFSVI